MRKHESHPKVAPEASRPSSIVSLNVRIRTDISKVKAVNGWVTHEGAREALRILDEACSAPSGVEIVMHVGRLHPMLLGDADTWRTLLSRYSLTLEAANAHVGREWHEALGSLGAVA